MSSTKELILYKDFENGKLFYDFTWLIEDYDNVTITKEDKAALYYECFHDLIRDFP